MLQHLHSQRLIVAFVSTTPTHAVVMWGFSIQCTLKMNKPSSKCRVGNLGSLRPPRLRVARSRFTWYFSVCRTEKGVVLVALAIALCALHELTCKILILVLFYADFHQPKLEASSLML